jgi:UDP:flavonoid glycosyltransferase YjiC (YdhE family)
MAQRILFVTSNGTGLGHLTRAMAIARRLEGDADATILTLSAAAPVAAHAGFHVEHFPSHTAAAAESPRRWDRRLRRRLEMHLAELRPDVLVFDGAHPYDGLVAVLRGASRAGLRAVWCRRPLWQPGAGAEGIYWSGSFDAVLEPGELAGSEDRGLTAERRDGVHAVPPILYLDRDELLPRERAEEELGLEPGRVNALVQLGQGPELDAAVERTLARLAAEPGVQVAALESGLSPGLSVPEGVVHLKATYPMSRFHRAFDLAVSAAGYNAFHELMAAGIPTLFVPMPRKLDDQPARARWAREAGVGEATTGPQDPELETALTHLLDKARRKEIQSQIANLNVQNGAAKAAGLLTKMTRREAEDSGGGVPVPAAAGRIDALAVSAQLIRRVGARLPLIVARRALDRLRNPPPPPARLVCIVLGLDPGTQVSLLRQTAERARLDPKRALAVTDSLDFAAFRREGLAFEYVPDEERAQPVLHRTGETYPDFAARRIKAALAGRRGARVLDLRIGV